MIPQNLVRQYLSLLNLEKIRDKGDIIEFRCPICGDSKSQKNHRSAMILGVASGNPGFYCHRGHPAMSFIDFVKYRNPGLIHQLFSDIRLANVNEYINPEANTDTRIVDQISSELGGRLSNFIKNIEITDFKLAIEYVRDTRKVPGCHHRSLYYLCDDVYRLADLVLNKPIYSTKYGKKYHGVVTELRNCSDDIVGICMRTFIGEPRYLHLTDSSKPLILFGEDKASKHDEVFVVEGLFDKLSFESNQVLAMLSNNPKFDCASRYPFVTYCFDNEIMSQYIRKRMHDVVKRGHKLFIWDNSFNVKDMNDLHVKYLPTDKEKLDYIKRNTYSGYDAILMIEKMYRACITRQSYMEI